MEALIDYGLEMVWIALTFFGGLVWYAVRNYLKTKTQIELGNFIDKVAIHDALVFGRKKVKENMMDMTNEIEHKNMVVEWAAEYMTRQFPKWLREYGASEEALKDWLETKFNKEVEDV